RESLGEERQEPTPIEAETRQTLLLARNGTEGQVAIPLSTVNRLEGFPASMVKRIGGREAMEYRGQVIPLIRLSQLVPTGMDVPDQVAAQGSIEVVIYSEAGRTVGLIVDCIIDIVEERAAVDPLASRPGVMGSYVREHTITEVLDVPAILRAAIPDLSARFETGAAAG
ncbi:MAG TPA: chemotaxis protein CheW, partial [Candidatus Binatia bacterium]|nr:chemotaxis protein CheW [Candidatus Binatia bacterium]